MVVLVKAPIHMKNTELDPGLTPQIKLNSKVVNVKCEKHNSKLLEIRCLYDITIGKNLLNQKKTAPFIKEKILNFGFFISRRAKSLKNRHF